MASLFRRLGTYRESDRSNPAENRLTEAFAGVLERVPQFAAAFGLWFGAPEALPASGVATQIPTASGGYVDLELRFGNLTRPSILLWVEAKHGSTPTAGQLRRYEHDISRTSADRSVLGLLVPSGVSMPSHSPEIVRYRTWQGLSRWLGAYYARTQATLSPVEAWLLQEFMQYLKEEGLNDLGGLRAKHVMALSNLDQARFLIRQLRDGAERTIESRGWVRVTGTNRDNGRFWRHFRPTERSEADWDERWRGGWFEWGLTSDRRLGNPRGDLLFGAGFTVRGKNPPPGPLVSGWATQLEAQDGFELAIDEHWRLYRYRYLDSVLADRDIEEQAATIGEWVVATFNILESSPLPHG